MACDIMPFGLSFSLFKARWDFPVTQALFSLCALPITTVVRDVGCSEHGVVMQVQVHYSVWVSLLLTMCLLVGLQHWDNSVLIIQGISVPSPTLLIQFLLSGMHWLAFLRILPNNLLSVVFLSVAILTQIESFDV